MGNNRKVALVTNFTDYAGPPALTALVNANFRVLAHDHAVKDADTWRKFSSIFPEVELLSAKDPGSLIEAAWGVAGRIDAIVSNDHFPAVNSPSSHVSLEQLRQTLEKLVVDPFALIQAAIPRFRAQGGGNVVMITSCRTHAPMQGGAIPDAARAAGNALVRSLAIELAPLSIAVNAVAPNFLYSEAYYPRATFIDDAKGRDYVRSLVPAGRLGRPEEIGELICYLASTESRFLTGAIVDFAGGWPAAQTRPATQ